MGKAKQGGPWRTQLPLSENSTFSYCLFPISPRRCGGVWLPRAGESMLWAGGARARRGEAWSTGRSCITHREFLAPYCRSWGRAFCWYCPSVPLVRQVLSAFEFVYSAEAKRCTSLNTSSAILIKNNAHAPELLAFVFALISYSSSLFYQSRR